MSNGNTAIIINNVNPQLLDKQRLMLTTVIAAINEFQEFYGSDYPHAAHEELETALPYLDGIQEMLDTWSDENQELIQPEPTIYSHVLSFSFPIKTVATMVDGDLPPVDEVESALRHHLDNIEPLDLVNNVSQTPTALD